MSFGQAVSTVFSKYATFSGRARRREYWWWYLFVFLVGMVANIADVVTGLNFGDTTAAGGWIATIAGLALFLPTLAVTIRRLHDTSKSGWWILIGLIPLVGWLILLYFYVTDSDADNQYGPYPKA